MIRVRTIQWKPAATDDDKAAATECLWASGASHITSSDTWGLWWVGWPTVRR